MSAGKEVPSGDGNIRDGTDVGGCGGGGVSTDLLLCSSHSTSFIVSRLTDGENQIVLTTLECSSDESSR